MKLSKKKMVLMSFMLFSLFFGAGNLIFPPFLGQNAGEKMPFAIAAFLITAVILPVLGVIVVAKFDGLDKLARKVDARFAVVFTILIYLSIGPGLGIPRAASVPFEMAVAPYLPSGSPLPVFMLLYSLVFFLTAGWLALTPSKLMERIGRFLTPSLLLLLLFLFVQFVLRGDAGVAAAQADYQANPMVKGFLEGYQTMDTIAALNFGLVIATTLRSLGVEKKSDLIHYTTRAGLAAGTIPFRSLPDVILYGNEKLRCLCDPGKRGRGAPPHCKAAVRRRGSRASGSHLHPGLPDHLRGAHHLHLPVFLFPHRPS